MTGPKRPVMTPLVPSCGSEKAASATALSKICARVTVPRSTSVGVSLRSSTMSANAVPAAILSAAAFASSALGNTICWTTRFSGVPKRAELAS